MSAPQTLPLESITAWSSGGTPSRSNDAYWNGTIPWISAATLKGSRISGSDQHLTEAGLRAGSNLAPKGATLVLVRGMALHRETRIGLVQLPVSFNQDVKALVPKGGILPEFLLYALQARSSQIRELVSSAGSGTGVLNTQLLQRLPIWVPSQETQRTVAQAMSDADDLIATLERLIAKKQAIKQGMMQQLLTGKTRLPGFSAQWDEVSLGESGTVSSGGVDKTSNPGEATVKLLNYMDVYRSEFIGANTVSQVVTAPPAKIAKCTIRAGDVFFTPTSEVPDDIARSAVADCDLPSVVYSYHLVRWRPSGDWDPSYLGFAFATERFRAQVSTLAAGSGTRYVVSMPGFRSLLAFRPPIEEQRAIGDLLRDTSLEVEFLRRRLAKARAVKTGMMQELLTGHTRLPLEEAAA